jgi:phage terminase large subunit-like protein
VVVTRGTTAENAANLAPAFLDQIVARYQGTRMGRQELDAELLEDVPGALWLRDKIEELRVASAPDLTRVVVAIDPSGTSGEDSDECGIVVCGVDARGHGYVLEDLSGRYPPNVWAKRAISAYGRHAADRVIGETNYGGEMVEATLRTVDQSVPFKKVVSSRGKVLRAEPVASLYEQGRVHHVGMLATLEDQQCGFTSDFDRAKAGYSPDRIDALVFGLTELMLGENCSGWIEFWKEDAARSQRGEIAPPPASDYLGQALGPVRAPPSTVKLRTTPHANFAPAKGIRVSADSDGLILCDPLYADALINAGCRRE